MESNDSGISLTPSYRQLSNEFRFESKRLQTFQSWPIDAPIESARVAKAGFYFTGRGYEVQCFACGGRISHWDYGDQAVSKHRQMNPSCPFLLNRSSNVPIQMESEDGHQNQPVEQIIRNTSSDSSSQTSQVSSNVPPRAPEHSEPSSLTQQSRPIVPNSLPTQEPQSPQSHILSHHEWLALRSEEARLRTYSQFTKAHPSPSELAKAGFFYLGVSDHVQCVFCRRVIKDWEENDDPLHEHMRLFPDCPFVLELPVGNIPIGSSPSSPTTSQDDVTVHHPASEGFDVSPRFSPEMRPSAHPDTGRWSRCVPANNLDGNSLEAVGIKKHTGPSHPQFSTNDLRLKTFEHWPSHRTLTPEMLAQTGFFYTGNRDVVQCFHCDKSLHNWEENDDPWIEHARWSPQCSFVRLMKGDRFIRQATKQRPPVLLSGPRELSEAELRALLDSNIVQTVLSIGIDLALVKMALKQRIKSTGEPFTSVDSLLEAATRLQRSNERRQALEDNNYATFEWHEIRPSRQETSSEATESESDVEGAGLGSRDSTVNEITTRREGTPEQVPEPLQPAAAETVEPQAQLEKPATEEVETITAEGTDKTKMLEEEIRRLREARLCKVCLDEEVAIAYTPCGHIVTCTRCSTALEQCPLCRKNIKGTVKIFFS